jgi:hypothetical protein
MPKTPAAPKPDEHPIAAAIGKTLGTIAKKTGLTPAAPATPKVKERLPRKLKKERKKGAAKAQGA